MLEQWELSNKGTKKQLYSAMFERRSLSLSSCLRALSEQEACDYRRYGLRNPIAVIPNGIAPLFRVSTDETLMAHPEIAGKKVVLFLSRVHFKKGIFNLIEAWRIVSEQDPNTHLVIAGGDFANTEAKARDMVRAYSLSGRVTFCGVVRGQEKLELLSAARVLCLPSYSEGLSVAVLEALSMGVPVVVTKACNIDGVDSSAAGFVTSNDPRKLSEALLTSLSLGTAEWEGMSARAQNLARDRYDWSRVGGMMASVYEWLLGGAKPACVVD
jgi:glycosyltransferase involved in cell wall biosynthesis